MLLASTSIVIFTADTSDCHLRRSNRGDRASHRKKRNQVPLPEASSNAWVSADKVDGAFRRSLWLRCAASVTL
eukprot:5100215-Alexandrium_andersonii.AAC.1